jgi:dynactin complex subunit
MNSNELREYVRKLNQQEQVQIELRRQAALKKIQALRKEIKYKRQKEQQDA